MNIHKAIMKRWTAAPWWRFRYCAKYDLPDSLYAYLAYGGTRRLRKRRAGRRNAGSGHGKKAFEPGQTVIECSSGSFAVALAVACAHSRHPLMLCMPATCRWSASRC